MGVVFWKNTKAVGCDLTDSSFTVVVVFPALLYQSNKVQSLNWKQGEGWGEGSVICSFSGCCEWPMCLMAKAVHSPGGLLLFCY